MSIPSLNASLLKNLQQGQTIIVDSSNNLRRVEWGESFIRCFNWNKAFRQDQEVAEWLIDYLCQVQNLEEYPQTLDAISKFAKTYQKTDATFKRLDNAIFAHKCALQISSLQVNELIHEDGTATSELLPFLKLNNLHYVIAKANSEHKATALLIDGEHIYIRAKEGEDFLDTPEHIDLILERIPPEHADVPLLSELCDLLHQTDDNSKEQDQEDQILEIREQLNLSHYNYQSLQDLHTDGKGILVLQAYLADGIEDFEHSHWSDLKPNFRESANEPSFRLRVITRLPAYALEKTWLGATITLIRHLFDFRAHGHSWVEIVEPIYDTDENFTEQQNIYNIGYYFHILDRYKRFESADPMAYMPIPSNHIIVEEVEISKEEFEKAQFYIEEVQALLKNPNRDLNDSPKNCSLSQEERNEIRYLYKSTLKSTCLSFANTLRELVTGMTFDDRSSWIRWLMPKKEFKYWDRLDTFIERTFILRRLIAWPRFLLRMELPAWVKKHPSPPPPQNQPADAASTT